MVCVSGFEDHTDSFPHACRFDLDQIEAQALISVLVNLFRTNRVFKTDAPCRGRRDEAQIADEEDASLEDLFRPEALQFAGKHIGDRMSEVDCQCGGINHARIMKLDFVRLIRRPDLPVSLQVGDGIDE